MKEKKYITKIITSDGYTFYLLNNGKVVDNLNCDLVDMSSNSLEEFLIDFEINILKAN